MIVYFYSSKISYMTTEVKVGMHETYKEANPHQLDIVEDKMNAHFLQELKDVAKAKAAMTIIKWHFDNFNTGKKNVRNFTWSGRTVEQKIMETITNVRKSENNAQDELARKSQIDAVAQAQAQIKAQEIAQARPQMTQVASTSPAKSNDDYANGIRAIKEKKAGLGSI